MKLYKQTKQTEKTEGGDKRTEIGRRRAENGLQRAEIGGWKSDFGWKTERQKAEVGRQTTEDRG